VEVVITDGSPLYKNALQSYWRGVEHQRCIFHVIKEEKLSEQDQVDLALMLTIAPELDLFRCFNQQFYRLFEQDITKPCARYRRTRMVNHATYQATTFFWPKR
jgi:transposase-like protein